MIHPRSCNAKPNFYPRSPCGERRACLPACVVGAPISIHALLAESDHGQSITLRLVILFLSTLSLRRATNSAYGALDGASISIHALLAESDQAADIS